jgi:hypothetical protein
MISCELGSNVALGSTDVFQKLVGEKKRNWVVDSTPLEAIGEPGDGAEESAVWADSFLVVVTDVREAICAGARPMCICFVRCNGQARRRQLCVLSLALLWRVMCTQPILRWSAVLERAG